MTTQNTPARIIQFSPPDITNAEIDAVAEAMRSGWITTGPKTKQLERELATFTGASGGFACFASATAALETCLRALGIGPGDEVITCAYTYTASASPIVHVGATPVLCDVVPGTFEMDWKAVAALVTPRTKAVIPVDLGGRMCDYDALYAALGSVADLWQPANNIQSCYKRVPVVSDAAHALGAHYKGRACGSVADFSTFSFHAVKNFTTAEGGGLAWRDAGFDNDEFYHQLMLWSLHGQDKDALAKTKPGAWEYDIVFPGYKCNMTDIMAAIGLVQLERYAGLLARRKQLINRYKSNLADAPITMLEHFDNVVESSGHLMLTRVAGATMQQRNSIIEAMACRGISTNVHYKPLPLMTAYKNLGFSMEDYPEAFAMYENEITLPLHTLLTDDDVDYICCVYKECIADVMGQGE